MRTIRLAVSLWLTMVGALILVGLLFRLPGFNTLSSQLASGFEDLMLITLLLFLNERYVHQPLHLRSKWSFDHQWRVGWPALLVASYAALVGWFSFNSFANLLMTLLVALLVGVFEEVLFRGILYPQLRSAFTASPTGILQAAALSSLLFSLTHLVNLSHQSWGLTALQLVFTFVLGMLLCGLYQQTGSLWWPLAIHVFNDFFSFSQPRINLPLIHTTAAFQSLEIVIVAVLAVWIFRSPVNNDQ